MTGDIDSSGRSGRRPVDEERLRQLLATQGESSALDYKAELHPDERHHLVALAKDIGAMAAEGGDIVVGADGRGQLTGRVSERDCELFDESRLRDKLRAYLPPGTVFRTAWHRIDGNLVVILAVDPHPLGVCVLAADGNYDGGCEFRAGEVFVRRGTQSVRWSEEEVRRFVERVREQQREAVRVELRQEWQAAVETTSAARTVSQSPATVTSWALDLDAFVEAVVEEVRRGDEIPLRRLLVALPREIAEHAREARGIERTADLLDRRLPCSPSFS